MSLRHAYPDPYLGRHVSPELEERARTDVLSWREDFSPDWLERLTRLRAYMLVALEGQKQEGDLFGIKLAHYSREWTAALRQAQVAAQAAAAQASGSGPGSLSMLIVPIERG